MTLHLLPKVWSLSVPSSIPFVGMSELEFKMPFIVTLKPYRVKTGLHR